MKGEGMNDSPSRIWRVRENGLWVDQSISRRALLGGAAGLALAGSLAACTGGAPSPSGASESVGAPRRGGNFRVGVTGGGSNDVMDAHFVSSRPDAARLLTAFETLLIFDDEYRLQTDGLAESVETDSPTQYTIRLRKGIEFHNGKTVTADDVIYSFQRIGNKELGLTNFASTATMDLANMKKMDELTVRLPLLSPDSTVPEALASYAFAIVPVGYDRFKGDPSTQVGTGAYKLKSFTPGQQSIHERNPNYWRGDGSPWFDQVTITNFSDPTAQVNALLGGQVDAMSDLPAAQIQTAEASGKKVLNSPTGGWTPLCMAIDMPPFDDNRVRQALRLVVDRQQMIDQVASGQGRVANDLYSPFDEGFNSDLPQRGQDIDKAKSLLRQAGAEGLQVELNTSPGAAGMVDAASVFATQAKAAGIDVRVKNVPNYYGDDYAKLAFSVDNWGTRNYLNQVQLTSLPTSPFNTTHWPPKSGDGSNFESLYRQALEATDVAKRNELKHEMQKLEYEQGGYIIPYFSNQIDGYAPNLAGLASSKSTHPLANYGHGFRSIWFTS